MTSKPYSSVADDIAQQIDEGLLVPTREMLDSLREVNAAVARWAKRNNMKLVAVTRPKKVM